MNTVFIHLFSLPIIFLFSLFSYTLLDGIIFVLLSIEVQLQKENTVLIMMLGQMIKENKGLFCQKVLLQFLLYPLLNITF